MENDESGFDRFYAVTAGRVLGQMYVLTGDLATAEDAVAEAYTRAWQRWSRVSTLDAPEAWVRTVASRIAVSAWRKARNRLLAHRHAAPLPSDPTGLSADRVSLAAAMQVIPERQRRAIVLHYLAGLTTAEIGREMNAAEGTVKSWLARGRKALATELGDPPLGEAAPAAAGGIHQNGRDHDA